MSVTQYIGARYVPLFAEPAEWSNDRTYEPLTIVLHQGNSYTSRQFVPKGIDITNANFWAETGNYNAQVEQYRREVQAHDGQITANAQAIADEVTARMAADESIRGIITELQGHLSDEVTARTDADTQIRTDFEAADAQIRDDVNADVNRLEDADTTLVNKINAIADAAGRKTNHFIGVSTHGLSNATAQKYSEYGCTSVRFDLSWDVIEKSANNYNFATYDQMVANAQAQGFKILFILDYNNPLYASSSSAKVTTESNRTAFVNYAKACVSHFSNVNCEWEVWNEPNNSNYTSSEYYELVKVTYNGIKSINPNATVVTGCISHNDYSRNWWIDCCKLGILNYTDKVSIHIYIYDDPEKYIIPLLVSYSAINASYRNGVITPLVVSEYGFCTYSDGNYTNDSVRAAWVLRGIMYMLGADVDSVYIYEGESTYTGNDFEEYFGLFDSNLNATYTANVLKPIALAIKNAVYFNNNIACGYEQLHTFMNVDDNSLFYVLETGKDNTPASIVNTKPDIGFNSITKQMLISLNYYRCGVRNPDYHSETYNDGNTATGRYSHAEGMSCVATGQASHAEGDGCHANADQTHVEGYHTTATKNGAHAGGMETTANGWASFAHGSNTVANKDNSAALGFHTVADRNNQLACGEWNQGNGDAYLVVGCGSGKTDRMNCFEVLDKGVVIRGDNGRKYKLHIDSNTGNILCDPV